MSIKLGDRAKDKITGFTGIVTGEYKYLNGCVRLQLDPEKLSEGKKIEPLIFDIEQVVLVKAGVHKLCRQSGGPMSNPPSRSAPTR